MWLLCLAPISGAQQAPDADAWGEAVDGVQLHLGVASVLPTLPGELPALDVQIRNQGPEPVVVRSEAIIAARIEIDGVWYRQIVGFTGTAMPIVVAPGAESSLGRIRPIASNMDEIDARPARQLELSPGSHRIRVQNAPEFPASQVRLAVETSSPELAEKMAGRDLPALVSNAITVDIPERSGSAEPDRRGAVARNAETKQDDDSEPTLVGVNAARIQPKIGRDGVLCIPDTYIKAQLTPAEQAREDNDPEVRRGREAVDSFLIADMTRSHSVLSMNYEHSEDHGDEIWFVYNIDYGCAPVVSAAHNQTTMSWNRKTGQIQGRNP